MADILFRLFFEDSPDVLTSFDGLLSISCREPHDGRQLIPALCADSWDA